MTRKYYRSMKRCLKLRARLYVVKQLWYLMYHDDNKYILNQTCEFCNEQFRYLEKIIFPKTCENYYDAEGD